MVEGAWALESYPPDLSPDSTISTLDHSKLVTKSQSQPMMPKIYIYIYVYIYNFLIGDFTILQWFLPYIHMNQPWMYMCYQQENLHTRLVLSGHKTSSSPRLPVRIMAYLMGLSQMSCPYDLNSTFLFQGCVFKTGPSMGTVGRTYSPRMRRA